MAPVSVADCSRGGVRMRSGGVVRCNSPVSILSVYKLASSYDRHAASGVVDARQHCPTY